MEGFKSHKNVVSNQMPRDKSTLFRGYNEGQNDFKAIGEYLCNQFAKNVTKTDRPVIGYL